MGDVRARTERNAVLSFWWLLELFSPQTLPRPAAARRAGDEQIVEWRPGNALPWETLKPPPPRGRTRMAWQHTVYLGVYELEATYETLHRTFGEDAEVYDERPSGQSAAAGLIVDQQGRLVPGSGILSSALWAVGRLRRAATEPQPLRVLQGFQAAADAFSEAVDAQTGIHDETAPEAGTAAHADAAARAPIDEPLMRRLLALTHAHAGVSGDELADPRIRIRSSPVSAERAGEPADADFLNSFSLDDLAMTRERAAAGDVGAALADYLSGEESPRAKARVDVVRSPDAVDAGVTVSRLPMGRWPSKPEHPLALSQQFAVNHALNDLGAAGLMGVNGPPGTGKTTMLRDILAGNVVERAHRLAGLERADDAFVGLTHRWQAGDGFPRTVRQLRAELTGFEMVVASANNAAVENVSAEIPSRKALGEPWRETADYFADLATAIARASGDEPGGEDEGESPGAWGLVAARLGNKANRSQFHSAFWFGEGRPSRKRTQSDDDAVLGMQDRLKAWQAAPPDWNAARARFRRAERRVAELLDERASAEQRRGRVGALAAQRQALRQQVAAAAQALTRAERAAAELEPQLGVAMLDLQRAAQAHDRQLAAKPGLWETIVSFGAATRRWREELAPYAARLDAAEDALHRVEDEQRRRRSLVDEAAGRRSALERRAASASAELEALRAQCAADARSYGGAYPGAARDADEREQRAPWLDRRLDAARSELFLAALRLHQDFIACTARTMSSGLRAAMDVMTGRAPRDLEPEKALAAWQLLFLVVPLISTTFASVGRMFRSLGRESLGWLLIDEAGQASPQHAAGAIWRARRVVAVGDPLQLPPVVTIPPKAKSALARGCRVGAEWIPPRASVQTLADRRATFGTTLRHAEEDVWVSMPLRVHRRCDDPMFSLCNAIAYGGIMVDGVKRTLDDPKDPDAFDLPDGPRVYESHWAHTPATVAGTHLQPEQIRRFERALEYLRGQGVPPSQVIAISPFKEVADRLRALQRTHDGLRAGTIHTAQGREAPVVILVLGGAPDRPGAKAWAASSVNLVNVAVSRAQRRLYVIGDRDEWAKHRYFRELAATLPATG